MTYIGIDPGKRTGFAVWQRDAKYLAEVDTMSITQAMERIRPRGAERRREYLPGQHDLAGLVRGARVCVSNDRSSVQYHEIDRCAVQDAHRLAEPDN